MDWRGGVPACDSTVGDMPVKELYLAPMARLGKSELLGISVDEELSRELRVLSISVLSDLWLSDP